jgi:hypothetical protein
MDRTADRLEEAAKNVQYILRSMFMVKLWLMNT